METGFTSSTSNAGQAAASARASQGFDFSEVEQWQRQVAQANFTGLRQFLTRNRQSQDWQDRYFVLDVVAPSIQPGSLDKLCASEPHAADLHLIRGVHLFNLVSKSRGTKTADRTTEQQIAQAEQFIKATIASLRQVIQMDVADPTPHVFAMRSFQVFSELNKHLQQAYQQAVRLVPDFVPAHFVMVNAQSKKWGGSHGQALQVARAALTHFKPGSDTAACLFQAHILVWQYAALFEKDKKRAEDYAHDGKVTQELNDAFDRWTASPYQTRRSSVPYLHHAAYWFYQAADRTRLQQALSKIAGKPWEKAWSFAGDWQKAYSSALEYAKTGIKPAGNEKKGGLFGWLK